MNRRSKCLSRHTIQTECITLKSLSYFTVSVPFEFAIQLIKHVFKCFCKGILNSLFCWNFYESIFMYTCSYICKKRKKRMAILGNDINCVCRLNLLIVGCSSNSLSIYAFGVFPVSRLTVPSINVDKVIQTFLWPNWSKCPRVNI